MGIVDRPDQVVPFATLDKRGRPEAQRYEDRFLSGRPLVLQRLLEHDQSPPFPSGTNLPNLGS